MRCSAQLTSEGTSRLLTFHCFDRFTSIAWVGADAAQDFDCCPGLFAQSGHAWEASVDQWSRAACLALAIKGTTQDQAGTVGNEDGSRQAERRGVVDVVGHWQSLASIANTAF